MITSQIANMANTEAKKGKSKLDELDKIIIPTGIQPEEKPQEVYNVLFKLVKRKDGRLWLDNCCDNVPNPKNNNIPERIWLLNGATSIWETDLENIMKDKKRYERARMGRSIVFENGVCRVRSTDVLMLEFMRRNTHNVGKRKTGSGKYDYYEYDPVAEQKDRHDKQLLKIEMVLKCKDMPDDKVKKLASFLGITFVDELGMPKSDEGLRTELMIKADTDPVTFQKYIDSKEIEVAYLVKKAILSSKIDLASQNGNAVWANGKGFIAKIPSTRKPYEYLTELAMTNSDEGRLFKEQLESFVN